MTTTRQLAVELFAIPAATILQFAVPAGTDEGEHPGILTVTGLFINENDLICIRVAWQSYQGKNREILPMRNL